MDITLNLNINAPELSAALNNLASAMAGKIIPTSDKEEIKKSTETKQRDKQKQQTVKESESEKTDSAPVVNEPQENNNPETVNHPATTKGVTLEEVRGKLAELTRAGKPVKELITKFGASKLSEIPPEKFAEVLKEAEGL